MVSGMVKNGITLLLGVAILFPAWIWSYGFSHGPWRDGAPVSLYIAPGSNVGEIQQRLAQSQVIDDDIRFRLLIRLMRAAPRLKAGEYSFAAGLTPYRIIRTLESGVVIRRAVTIPEGFSLEQIAALLDAAGLVRREIFLDLVRDPAFVHSLGIGADTLEGYIFPDTYYLSRGMEPKLICRIMTRRLFQVLAALCGAREAGQRGGLHELLTLASIVEKETASAGERVLVAGVFLNRLRQKMRLQADPTVLYGLGRTEGSISLQDLRLPTPYNTYVINGLPPGPIANPGQATIQATLTAMAGLDYEWPEALCNRENFSEAAAGWRASGALNYLYFVSKNDGSHQFSRSLAEHNRAVKQYQR